MFSLTSGGTKKTADQDRDQNLQSKSMDWLLYNRDLHHERVKDFGIHEFLNVS